VTLNLNGQSVAVTPTCNTISGSGAANRQCTIDIPLNDPNWTNWNSVVGTDYQGLFDAFATDTSNGVYATGVSATASIVVTDSAGKSSKPQTLNIHVHSSENNAPIIAYAGSFVPAIDSIDSQTYPTYTCSVSAGAATGGCGLAVRGQLVVNVLQSVTASPGPAAAFDELASQTTEVVDYVDPNDQYTNVQCTQEQDTSIFIAGGGPYVAASGGGGSKYDMNFLIPTVPPASAVSAICTLQITDAAAAFPNGQSAKTASKAFRLVITP
jgi:hypothetical protein